MNFINIVSFPSLLSLILCLLSSLLSPSRLSATVVPERRRDHCLMFRQAVVSLKRIDPFSIAQHKVWFVLLAHRALFADLIHCCPISTTH